MTEKAPERLLEIQRRFAGHLRDPENVPPPAGMEDRRLAIYRRLFFNNLSNLFARNFPVIRKLHGDEAWAEMIRAFMIRHRSSTPMFTEIGGELVEFIAERQQQGVDQAPWLAELAHWEYLETCVRLNGSEVSLDGEGATGKDESTASAERFLQQQIRVNPTLKIAQYQWPVHRIGPKFTPEKADPVVLAVYRRASDRVAFMQVNALTAVLLQTLNSDDAPTLIDAVRQIAEQIQQPVDTLSRAALTLIETLIERELILGPG